MAQFLDKDGLDELWSKIKGLNNKKQDALTTAQLSACNSGITSSKVSTYDGYSSKISAKQDALVSGTNIKTINNLSLLGSGNLLSSDICPRTTTVTSGSTSLVTSGGVYSAISTLAKINNSGSGYIDIQRTYSTSYRMRIVRGTFSVSRTSGTTKYSGSVTLASSMPANTYQLFISRNGNMGYNNYMPYVKSKTTAGFDYYIEFLGANSDTVTFDYLAVYTA